MKSSFRNAATESILSKVTNRFLVLTWRFLKEGTEAANIRYEKPKIHVKTEKRTTLALYSGMFERYRGVLMARKAQSGLAK